MLPLFSLSVEGGCSDRAAGGTVAGGSPWDTLRPSAGRRSGTRCGDPIGGEARGGPQCTVPLSTVRRPRHRFASRLFRAFIVSRTEVDASVVVQVAGTPQSSPRLKSRLITRLYDGRRQIISYKLTTLTSQLSPEGRTESFVT